MTTSKDRAFSRVWLTWQENPAYRALPARSLRVLTAIAQFQEGSCLPTRSTVSYRWICEVTGLNKSDVSRAVKSLETAGLVHVLWRSDKGTCYELLCPSGVDEGVGADDNPVGVRDNSPVGLDDNGEVVSYDNHGVGDSHQPIKNLPNNEEKNRFQQYDDMLDDPEGFRELWRMWPNRNGSRADAAAIFGKLVACGIKPEMLLSIAREYKRSFDKESKYFPQLARWLNPDDAGGWIELYEGRRARKREDLLRKVDDEDLQEVLAHVDERYKALLENAREDPFGGESGYADNRSRAESYFANHRALARNELVREPLAKAGFVDVSDLPAFDEFQRVE